MTNDEIIQSEIALYKKYPLELVSSGLLKIKTKEAQMVKLRLKSAQANVYRAIRSKWVEGKPIRLLILKARQTGISTLIQGIYFALVSQLPNINCLTIADIKDRSNALFEMSKLYEERLRLDLPHLLQPLKKSNEKKIEFDGIHSQMSVETAEDLKAGRATTQQLVHLSECAYYRNAGELLTGLLQSVPYLPRTIIIAETTANGQSGWFYDEWKKAEDKASNWIPIFISWFDDSDYSMPLPWVELQQNNIIYDNDLGKPEFLKEEKELQQKYKISNEQLNWRRHCIVNQLSGDVSKFRQEYPSYPEEAFITSGNCYFPVAQLRAQQQRNIKPIMVGNIVEIDGGYSLRVA